MSQGYKPHRQCRGCMVITDKDKLVRIADSPDGVKLDKDGSLPGRGCYVCRDIRCLETALKKNAFQRSLKHGIDKDQLQKLKEDFIQYLSNI